MTCQLEGISECVSAFQSGNNAFALGKFNESGQCFTICDAVIFSSADFLQVSVFGSYG